MGYIFLLFGVATYKSYIILTRIIKRQNNEDKLLVCSLLPYLQHCLHRGQVPEMLWRKKAVFPRRLLLSSPVGTLWARGVVDHGEGERGGSLQEDALRVSHTVPEEWRVHIWSGSEEERTVVWWGQEAMVQCLRGLELPEGLPLPSLRAHLGQDLTQGSCLGGMPRQQ